MICPRCKRTTLHELAPGRRYCSAMGCGFDETACRVPPPGWPCTRAAGHDGPCTAHPVPREDPRDAAVVAARRFVIAWVTSGSALSRESVAAYIEMNRALDAVGTLGEKTEDGT